MNRLLLVSSYFPPSTLAGVHRARHLSKHLPATGWSPTILCVDEAFHVEELDWEMANLLPKCLDIVKVKALPYSATRLAGVGDIGLRAFPQLRRAAGRILDKKSIDAIFITGSPFYPMLLSNWLKRRYRKPVVLDFQDPWVSAYAPAGPPFSKLGLAHRLATHLEPLVIRSADYVTSVSDIQNVEMRQRYPWLKSDKMAAIPIGGDVDDFNYLKSKSRPCPWMRSLPGSFTVSYVGNVWPGAHRTLAAFFAAVARLKAEQPEAFRRLHLTFVGSSNQSRTEVAEVVMPFARRAGVAEKVDETPQRIPYLDALNVMIRSDALLMLGSSEPHYTASKLYPALLAKRPIMAIFHEDSSVCPIAETIGGVMLTKFGDGIPVESKVEEITQSLAAMIEGRAAIRKVDRNRIEPFLGPAIARRFADVFNRLTALG